MMPFAEALETALEYWLGTDAPPWDFHIYTTSQKAVSRDVTGYTTEFLVKADLADADASALITKSGSIVGAFNSSPTLNTQRIRVTLVDTETDTEIEPGLAYWELKRTDAGLEAVLAYGPIHLRRAVHVA